MRAISQPSPWIEDAFASGLSELGSSPKKGHPLVEDQMNKIELATAEEIVVDTIEVPTELSLSELDMIGGGAFGVLLM